MIAAAVGEIDAMITRLSPERILEKDGLAAQKRDLLDDLAVIDAQVAASVSLEFSGDPVLGSRGMDARFGAAALAKYQALVSSISPEDDKLLVVGTLRNSFGFELQEVYNPLFRSALHDAVATASELMAAAAESDAAFLTAIGQQESAVPEALTDFIGVLKAHGATCRIVASGRDVSLDKRRVEMAAERATTVRRDTTQSWIMGEFRGVTLDSRWFDFMPEDGAPIRGKAQKKSSVDLLEEWNRRWMRVRCRALIQTVTTSRLGSVSRSHVLLNLDDGDSS